MYAHINCAWYSLKYGKKIAHDDLVEHLEKHNYVQADNTNGIFKHIACNISFTLIVNYSWIKYANKADFQHLIKVIQEKYNFNVDFNTIQYIWIHLNWNCEKQELICSMKGYMEQGLKELEHILSLCNQAAPFCLPGK